MTFRTRSCGPFSPSRFIGPSPSSTTNPTTTNTDGTAPCHSRLDSPTSSGVGCAPSSRKRSQRADVELFGDVRFHRGQSGAFIHYFVILRSFSRRTTPFSAPETTKTTAHSITDKLAGMHKVPTCRPDEERFAMLVMVLQVSVRRPEHALARTAAGGK